MSKRIIAVIAVLAIALSVFAAGCKKKTKTVVVYLNSSSSVSETANVISKSNGGDLYELTPAKKYSDDELTLSDKGQRVKTEQEKNTKVEIKNPLKDIKKYDKVYVVYPVWYEKAPRIIVEFVKTTALEGKSVTPIAVSNISDITPTLDELKKAAPKAKWVTGVRFSESLDPISIDAWVRNSEGITQKTTKEK
ncbi:MAG: hypothetical protein IJT65_05875 [Eubacterium sp.]|nr:hypothetical protein [Eubacterium sp.]